MTFLEGLCRDGLTYDKSYGDWVSPQVFSTACNNILFTCTEPEWTYIAETENLQNKPGVDDDIFDTVSEFSSFRSREIPLRISTTPSTTPSDTWCQRALRTSTAR